MVFPVKSGPRPCPVEGCSSRLAMRTAMWMHFWNQHVRDTVVILKKGNIYHLRLPLCDILVPWRSLNMSHQCTVHCKNMVERKRRRLVAEMERAVN